MFAPRFGSVVCGDMRKLSAMILVLCFPAAIAVFAQVSFRGRIFLPTGEPVTQPIRIIVSAEDPIFTPQIHYTDSKGWFYLHALRANMRYTITVESDEKTWATTSEWFFAGRDHFISIMLNPLTRGEAYSKSGTISVQQLQYKPRPEAKRAFEEGQKAYAERNVELARQKLRQAVELDPGYVSAYNDLAALEIDEKRYTEAEPLLHAAMEKDPEAVLPLLNLGIVLDHLGRYQEAVPILRKNLQLRPNWLAPKIYLGIALVETDGLDEAERLLLRCVAAGTSDRESALAYLYLGKLYAMKDEREKAVSAWENYLTRDPDSPNAAKVRNLLVRLRTLAKQP